MKKILTKSLLAAALFAFSAQPLLAQSKNLNRTGTKEAKAQKSASEIQWLSLDDVQVAMKKKPKKVWVDVYTGWCGWCKVMDQKTFSNPEVIKYVNEHFYMVKVDAEQKEDIRFMGKMYSYLPERRVNAFAMELLQGQLSYPSGVFMEENFQNPQIVPGYLDVANFEMIIKYLGQGAYKNTKFEDWQQSFKASWM